MGVSLVGTIVTMMATRAISYKDNFPLKFLSWTLFNTAMAVSLTPLAAIGGPILIKAAMLTCAMVGSLSLVAAASPSESFLWMGGPLTIGLGVVFISSLGTMFFPASAMLENIVLYGGLGIFGGFVLFDTQK